jgi:hypothetical protein
VCNAYALMRCKTYQIAARMQALCGIARQESAQQPGTFRSQHHIAYPANVLPMRSARRLQEQSNQQHFAMLTKLGPLEVHAEPAAA